MTEYGDGTITRFGEFWHQLPLLATVAVVADAVTTAAFLSEGLANEQNNLLVAGLEYGVSGGALMFVMTQGILLAMAWLSLGAVSTYIAVYLVITMGLGGGLNNALLLLTGESLLAPLGSTLAYLGPPCVATVVCTTVVNRLHSDPRWSLVIAVAGILLVGEIISFVG